VAGVDKEAEAEAGDADREAEAEVAGVDKEAAREVRRGVVPRTSVSARPATSPFRTIRELPAAISDVLNAVSLWCEDRRRDADSGCQRQRRDR
jgi:hypothetical protein